MDMFTENDAHSTMLTMIFHARLLAQVVKCVAEFSLADHLSGEPRSPESVAEAAGLDREATYRLLRYCSVVGLASAEGDGRYRETPLLATLRSDDPLFLRSFALAQVSSHADGGESHPALSSRRVGSYTFQAAIASVHADAPNAAATDWAQIAGLYDVLVYVEPSPVVELNRAVAVAKRNGPDAGLALIDAILARRSCRLPLSARGPGGLVPATGENGRNSSFLRKGAHPSASGAGTAVSRTAIG
jgi:hypothetical protein